MVYFLILISSLGFGLFFYHVLHELLVKLDHEKQQRRLANIVQKRTAIPLQDYIDSFRERFTGFVSRTALQKYLIYLERQLRRANITYLNPMDLLAYQLLGAVFFSVSIGCLAGSFELSVISLGAGLILPFVWLNDKVQKREKDLLRELPNALEILSLCSEAGLSLEQGLEQYLKNAKQGPLKDELSKIMEQTRTGAGRKKAFLSVEVA